ncbi:hypothetical protein Naga_100013g40 [Nannochloropsis gaditana]|uniref:Uncharacterized protein n=1 Tax=Nannochloropsis gaditana TaxID=72520 RepID=W7U444_9STRA|nr:hypothetical protein Naga_100013g40 [Nannochloropsis gaditana]
MDSNRPTKRLIHHYIKQHRGWHNVCSLTAVRKAHMRVIVSGIAVLVTCLLVTNLILERRNGRGGNFLHLLRLGGINAGAPARLRQDLPLLGKARSYVSYDCGGGCAKSNILLLQTSDGGSTSTYSKMLDALQSTHLAYAAQRGFHYLRWDGLMKGRQAWHATYNRIFLLHALHESRRYEWVLFLDPDAIVRDPRLNVEDLLDDRYAVLGCRGGDDPDLFWDINIGVAFFNLRHKEFGSLMKEWMAAVQKVAPWTLERGGGTAAYITMGQGPRVRDDQQMFHDVLSRHPMGKALVKRYYSGEDAVLFNYNDGKYVAHLTRADNLDQDARLLRLLVLKAAFFKSMGEMAEEDIQGGRRVVEARQREGVEKVKAPGHEGTH